MHRIQLLQCMQFLVAVMEIERERIVIGPRSNLKKINLKNLLITAPENVAWILNIRGKDNSFSPIPNCNAIVNDKKKLFL